MITKATLSIAKSLSICLHLQRFCVGPINMHRFQNLIKNVKSFFFYYYIYFFILFFTTPLEFLFFFSHSPTLEEIDFAFKESFGTAN